MTPTRHGRFPESSETPGSLSERNVRPLSGESLHRGKQGDCAMNVRSRERWETGSGEELTSSACRQDGSRRSFRLM